jgi:hypothetical protein
MKYIICVILGLAAAICIGLLIAKLDNATN